MLVITRKDKQCVIIDGKIEVHVLQSKRGRVRLAIHAPADVEIMRGELILNNLESDENG